MKTRFYQKFHDYVLGNHANIEEGIEKIPEKNRESTRKKRLKEINNFFFNGKTPLLKKANKQKFRTSLRRLNAKNLEFALFGNVTDTLDEKQHPYPIPDDKEIETKFNELEEKHKFFTGKDKIPALNQYKTYFKIAKLIADLIENNNTPGDRAAYNHAYKLLVIFGNELDPKKYFKSLEDFLTGNNFQEKETPLHDALLSSLPINDPIKNNIHLAEWRKIIYSTGPKACRIFGKANQIEEKLNEEKPHAPQDFRQAFYTAKLITYKKMTEDK